MPTRPGVRGAKASFARTAVLYRTKAKAGSRGLARIGRMRHAGGGAPAWPGIGSRNRRAGPCPRAGIAARRSGRGRSHVTRKDAPPSAGNRTSAEMTIRLLSSEPAGVQEGAFGDVAPILDRAVELLIA